MDNSCSFSPIPATFTSTIYSTEEKAELSPFESLCDELLWQIFDDSKKDRSSLVNLRLVSSRFKVAIDGWAERLVRLFISIHTYVPRTLTDEELKLPVLQQLQIAGEIVNQTDSKGAAPLIRATLQAKVKPEALRAMRILVLLGADVNQSIGNGWTAARYAAYWKIDLAASLLKEMQS